MKFRFRFADQIVGLFVLSSVVLVCVALILIGINKRWLRDDLIYRSSFVSASGLREGLPVNLKGVKIGEIKDFYLNDKNHVDVTVVIYEEHVSRIVPKSVLELQANPLGLGAQLVFYPSIHDGESLNENDFIISATSKEGKQLLKKDLVDKGDSGDIIVTVINDVDDAIVSLNRVLVSLGDTLEGDKNGPIGELLASINYTMDGVNSNIIPEIENALADITKISGSIVLLGRELETIEGLVPKLLDPEGSIAKILDDDNELYNEVYSILDELHKSMTQVRELTEYFNGLSPEISSLVENTGTAIEEAEKVLQGIKNNPLLRGGIEEEKKQDSVSSGIRDGDF